MQPNKQVQSLWFKFNELLNEIDRATMAIGNRAAAVPMADDEYLAWVTLHDVRGSLLSANGITSNSQKLLAVAKLAGYQEV